MSTQKYMKVICATCGNENRRSLILGKNKSGVYFCNLECKKFWPGKKGTKSHFEHCKICGKIFSETTGRKTCGEECARITNSNSGKKSGQHRVLKIKGWILYLLTSKNISEKDRSYYLSQMRKDGYLTLNDTVESLRNSWNWSTQQQMSNNEQPSPNTIV